MITVADFMSSEPITVTVDISIPELVKKMVLCGITGMPVVDEAERMIGIISIVDIIDSAYPSFKEYYDNPQEFQDFSVIEKKVVDFNKKTVADFMTKKVHIVKPSDSLAKAFAVMNSKGVGRLPVVEDGAVVGMIDVSDIFHGLIVEKIDTKVDLKDSYRKRTKNVKHKAQKQLLN